MLCCSICFVIKYRYCECVEVLDEIVKGIEKLNVERNIGFLFKLVQVVNKIVENKECMIREFNVRKEIIFLNVFNEIENLKIKFDEC